MNDVNGGCGGETEPGRRGGTKPPSDQYPKDTYMRSISVSKISPWVHMGLGGHLARVRHAEGQAASKWPQAIPTFVKLPSELAWRP